MDKSIATNQPSLARELGELMALFLNSLSKAQLRQTAFEFDATRRREFEYIPAARSGLKIGDMSAAQRATLFKFIDIACGERGARLTRAIIALEETLKEWEALNGWHSRFERSSERYWLAVFGDPADGAAPWSYQFSGHHVIINGTVFGAAVALTPMFLGANPATVLHGESKGAEPLKEEGRLARELLMSLTPRQKQAAIASTVAPYDIITRNYRDARGVGLPPGIKFADLTARQRGMLAETIKIYVDRLAPRFTKGYWEQIAAHNFHDCEFVWAGAPVLNEPHYYAIHSKRFVIEYDRTQDNANHVHSVMRDRANDWGADMLAAHYAAAHNGGS